MGFNIMKDLIGVGGEGLPGLIDDFVYTHEERRANENTQLQLQNDSKALDIQAQMLSQQSSGKVLGLETNQLLLVGGVVAVAALAVWALK